MENLDERREVISIQNLWAGYEHDVVSKAKLLAVVGLVGFLAAIVILWFFFG